MPKFRYQAIDHLGRNRTGTIDAQSFQTAVQVLNSRGLWTVKMYDENQSILRRNINFEFGPKVKTKHFAVFCRQLATMYKAGIGLLDAVLILSEQTESKVLRKVLREMGEEMKNGTQFSAAAADHPKVFSSVFIYAVRAGETGGTLDEMLNRFAVLHEKEHYTREKIKTAMIYPAIMAIVTVLVIVFMMIFVIPKYVQNYQAMNMQLPLPTLLVMKLSNWVQSYWHLLIGSLFLPGLVTSLMKRTRQTRYLLDSAKLKIPLFGSLWHKQAVARFSRTFSSLYSAAVPMPETMLIASRVVNNEVMGSQILESRKAVMNGQSIADSLKKSSLFPPMVVHMLAIGDKTGSLDSLLDKVADYYESDVDMMAERLRSYLEPVMLLFLAVMIGGIVLAVMLPSFTLMRNF